MTGNCWSRWNVSWSCLPGGLNSYGGNYSFYTQTRAHERQQALQELNERKLERQRQDQAMRKQRERQERRQARGTRQAREGNQAKVLLDKQKERSEVSSGTLRRQHDARRAQLNAQVREAARQVEDESQITLHGIPVAPVARRHMAELDGVVLPFVSGPTSVINLMVRGRQRIGVIGPNGYGKSTLLRVLAGQLQPRAGRCEVIPAVAYLDQRLGDFDPEKTVLDQLQTANGEATEGSLRMRLAQLGLGAEKIATPSGALSGGERLKGALACLLYSDSPPQLLLLDEPNNHLDLPSLQALETMLSHYRGALIVVSHDDSFLDRLELTERLFGTDQGWRLEQT